MNWIGMVQAGFYIFTGVWPFVSLRTFLAVTGPKTDIWLVKTVAALIVVLGAALMIGSMGPETQLVTVSLGLLSPLALAAVDIYYVLRGTISKIYLADAAVEVAFLLYWIWFALSALDFR
jgi:hypothetical protein